jgi:hypothetical protein
MSYTKTTWKEDGTTPITAAQLNRMETQYDNAIADSNWFSTNANGTFHRLANGTQICQFNHNIPGDGTNFRNAELFFPAAFLAGTDVAVTVSVYQSNAGASRNSAAEVYGTAISESKYRWGAYFPVAIATTTNIVASIIAVGRWK